MRLLDTNVLVYAHDQSSPKRSIARQLLMDALIGKEEVRIAPQDLLELFSVITSPKRVENPLSATAAPGLVRLYWGSRRLAKVAPTAAAMDRALNLIENTGITRARVFDAMFAATALEHGVTEIVTDNERDLARLGMTVVNPF